MDPIAPDAPAAALPTFLAAGERAFVGGRGGVVWGSGMEESTWRWRSLQKGNGEGRGEGVGVGCKEVGNCTMGGR